MLTLLQPSYQGQAEASIPRLPTEGARSCDNLIGLLVSIVLGVYKALAPEPHLSLNPFSPIGRKLAHIHL